ncbi:hypothetical protein [Clostridium thermarum]|uniref:hypothetical protein n=1 Tax=Clostridium thermarum TaxID=1716543 RepID=UPI00111FC639|nr:hypothetical protein [Clostridium thermarum]
MIILYLFKDVNSYSENIHKYKYGLEYLRLKCPKCGCILCYWGSYEVNYVDDDCERKLLILRGMCKKCEQSHSIKPWFLPGKHQYALPCREAAVLAHRNEKVGLRRALRAGFKKKEVSLMNLKYWIETTARKCSILISKILAIVQKHFGNEDTISTYVREIKRNDNFESIYRLSKWYIELITCKAVSDCPESWFNIINTISNIECTGLYL